MSPVFYAIGITRVEVSGTPKRSFQNKDIEATELGKMNERLVRLTHCPQSMVNEKRYLKARILRLALKATSLRLPLCCFKHYVPLFMVAVLAVSTILYASNDAEGRTALIRAIQENNIDLVKILLEKGSNVNARDAHGRTPIMYAIQANNVDMVKMLLQSGATLNIQDYWGDSPLKIALDSKNMSLIREIIKDCVDVNELMIDRTPLIVYASERGLKYVVNLLLEKGAKDVRPCKDVDVESMMKSYEKYASSRFYSSLFFSTMKRDTGSSYREIKLYKNVYLRLNNDYSEKHNECCGNIVYEILHKGIEYGSRSKVFYDDSGPYLTQLTIFVDNGSYKDFMEALNSAKREYYYFLVGEWAGTDCWDYTKAFENKRCCVVRKYNAEFEPYRFMNDYKYGENSDKPIIFAYFSWQAGKSWAERSYVMYLDGLIIHYMANVDVEVDDESLMCKLIYSDFVLNTKVKEK